MNPLQVGGGRGGRGFQGNGRGARNERGRGGQNGGAQDEAGAAGGVRRRRVDGENGDRYCSSCGQVIFGQSRDLTGVCPYAGCGAAQPYMNPLWQFSFNGWGRCRGRNCLAFLENSMLYCTACGHLNAHAFERRERQERARRQQEDYRLRERIRALEADRTRLEDENRDMARTIQSQENELVAARELPPNMEQMLLEDENDEDPPAAFNPDIQNP